MNSVATMIPYRNPNSREERSRRRAVCGFITYKLRDARFDEVLDWCSRVKLTTHR